MSAWTSYIPQKIVLTYLSSENIKGVLFYWKRNEFDIEKLKKDPILYAAFQFLIPYLENNRHQTPIRSIFACVSDHYNAFALIERPYLDLEFWDSYSGFYSYSFSQYKIDCIRIHFFKNESAKLTEENNCQKLLKGMLEIGATSKQIENELHIEWIGYSSLRPIHSNIVGRTALKFDERPISQVKDCATKLLEEIGGKPYIKAAPHCTANLMSTHFSIDTPEFIQQDPNIGQCATASLWVANKIMAERFGTSRLFYRSITKQSVGLWSREFEVKVNDEALNNDGTTVAEIKNTINAIGARTIQFTHNGSDDIDNSFIRLTNEIYSFVESGFPVFLCINNKKGHRHVITIVAHCLPHINGLDFQNISKIFLSIDFISKDIAKLERHYLVGNRINVYYCHDDAYGPFNRICLRKYNKTNNIVSPILIERGRDKEEFYIENIIVPVSPYVKTSSYAPFKELISWFNKRIAEKYSGFLFLWRSLLILGSDFKISLTGRNYHECIKEWYSKLHLPKFIWLFELSISKPNEIKDHFYYEGFKTRYIVGEFLYDATISEAIPRMMAGRIGANYIDYSFELERLEKFKEISKAEEYWCYSDKIVDEIKNTR